MIRCDLQANRKLQADLRQDKLAEADRIKTEYGAKLNELERTVAAKHTEMEFMVWSMGLHGTCRMVA